MSNAKSKLIQEQMLEFAVDTIRFLDSAKVPNSTEVQLVKSATSIGANYTEAQDASSKRDFVNKIYIAKKEASETRYWLRLTEKLTGENSELSKLIDQSQQFVMMLQKIVNTSRG